MSDEKCNGVGRLPGSCPPSARTEKTESIASGSDRYQDFEYGTVNRQRSVRASSWDDSDENSPRNLDLADPAPTRIYTSDDRRVRRSVSLEINEIKKQFFKALEKESALNGGPALENLRDELDVRLCCDRRQSPARVRRRTKSSGTSSPVLEMESRFSPEIGHKPNPREIDFFEISPKFLEYDPTFYLNNFFTELRTKRINLIEPLTTMEDLREETPSYDRECIRVYNELGNLEAKENGSDLCSTSRKLFQILEVEESKKESDKRSEESVGPPTAPDESPSTPHSNKFSPLQTNRSRKSQKRSPEYNGDSRTKKKEKFKSLSSESFKNNLKLPKPSPRSLSERSTRFFDNKLDANTISLTSKKAKTHLTFKKCEGGEDESTPVQLFCDPGGTPRVPNLTEEKTFDSLESPSGDLAGNPTPEKSTARSERSQTNRSRVSVSHGGWDLESPKFMLNIERDSVKSLTVEEANGVGFQEEDKGRNTRSEDGSFRNRKSERPEQTTGRKSRKSLESLGSVPLGSFRQEVETPNQPKSQRSRRKDRKQKNTDLKPEEPIFPTETTESPGSNRFSADSSRSVDKSPRSFHGTNIFERVLKTPDSKSSKNSKSSKLKTPKTTESRFSNQSTPKSARISGAGFPLDISERTESERASHRDPKPTEFDKATTEHSESNPTRSRSGRSEHSSTSFKHSGTRASTPRDLNKSTPRTNSSRVKDNSENQEESENSGSHRVSPSKELCDSGSSGTLVSCRSSSRELETPNQQLSHRSEISAHEPNDSGAMESLEKSARLSGRRSLRSAGSHAVDSPHNISSTRSGKTKSRPGSWSKEYPSVDFENKDPVSGRTSRSSISEEGEDLEESQSIHTFKMGDESDRYSSKRLSIINEVSFEDLETSNVSTENDEKETEDQPPPSSKRSRASLQSPGGHKSDKNTPKSSSRSLKGKSSSSSFKDKYSDESGSTETIKPKEKWNELIEKFQESPNSSFSLENNFPGFQDENKFSWDSIGSLSSRQNRFSESSEKPKGNLSPRSAEGETLETNSPFERVVQEKNSSNLNLAPDDVSSSEKFPKGKKAENYQNVFHFNVDQKGPFGIGEFGDVTCWNVAEFDTTDFEKPKDHGDGVPTQKTTENLSVKPQKNEKEYKIKRPLWAELKDFRDLNPLSSNTCLGMDDDFTCFIPTTLKTSKSENCIIRKGSQGSECRIFEISSTLNLNKTGVVENEEANVLKSTMQRTSSSGSVKSERADSETGEFDFERLPRLSRSLFEIDTRLQETVLQREPNKTFPDKQLFKKVDGGQMEKEYTDLNIFLAPKEKEDKIEMKSNNWLTIKSENSAKTFLQSKKVKTKPTKGAVLHKEGYLTSRKSRSSVPPLKLRNPNCFQNFYKRLIGVFCLTSDSSVATSK